MNAQNPPSVDTNMTRVFMNAAIQWFADMDLQHMNFVCDATMFDVGVLKDSVNGLHQIVLNLSGRATRHFRYNEDNFEFYCGFQGQDVHLVVPYEAVLGFNVPLGEQFAVTLPMPNLERHIMEMSMLAQMAQQKPGDYDGDKLPSTKDWLVPNEDIPPGAYAVHGVAPETHDENGEELPKIADLMRRPAPRKEEPVKEKPEPLLDFGTPGMPVFVPRRKKRNAPHLTLIQGGKQ